MAADYNPTSIRVKPKYVTRFEFRTELAALVVPDIGVLVVKELPNIARNSFDCRTSDPPEVSQSEFRLSLFDSGRCLL